MVPERFVQDAVVSFGCLCGRVLASAAAPSAFSVHSVREAFARRYAQGRGEVGIVVNVGGFACCAHWREAGACVVGEECLALGGELAIVRPVVIWCHFRSLGGGSCAAVFSPIVVVVATTAVSVRPFGSGENGFGEHGWAG